MTDEMECEHGLWPPSKCSQCHPERRSEKIKVPLTDGSPFFAKFPGKCGLCGETVSAGEQIIRLSAGGYAHNSCAENKKAGEP